MKNKFTVLSSILVFLLVLNGCSNNQRSIDIAPPPEEEIEIDTVRVPVEEDIEEPPKDPSIEITSPKDLELIENENVIVNLEVSNFNLVLPGQPVKDGEGIVQVWLDSTPKKSGNTEIIFRRVSSGSHSITAELRKSDNTPLSPRIIETISIIVDNPKIKIIPRPQSVSVEADDLSFYPSTINTKKNQTTNLNLIVRTRNVYFSGLQFDSKHFATGSVLPGFSTTVRFTASEDFNITSYWPSTKVRKSILKVIVE